MNVTYNSSTSPPRPPDTEEQKIAWIRLLRSRRVGPATFQRLMKQHDWDAEQAIRSLPEVALSAGVVGYSPCARDIAKGEYRAARLAGAQMIALGMDTYPHALGQIDDAPPFLWAIGDTALLKRPLIALIGARNASSLGQRMARKLAEGLGEAGFVVVSGLARGIDTVAHHGALTSGTVAVMASGVDVIYPRENTELARAIGNDGLLLSENPMGHQPQARHFPSRNRIISGLCRGVVVVEAAAKSGTLITARAAAEQGRDVLAVPGHPFDARASGSNALLRDGATLVRGVNDVLEALSPDAVENHPVLAAPDAQQPLEQTPAKAASLRETAALHAKILNRLSPSPIPEDQLIRDVGERPERTIAQLSELELEGKIERRGPMLSLSIQ